MLPSGPGLALITYGVTFVAFLFDFPFSFVPLSCAPQGCCLCPGVRCLCPWLSQAPSISDVLFPIYDFAELAEASTPTLLQAEEYPVG